MSLASDEGSGHVIALSYIQLESLFIFIMPPLNQFWQLFDDPTIVGGKLAHRKTIAIRPFPDVQLSSHAFSVYCIAVSYFAEVDLHRI